MYWQRGAHLQNLPSLNICCLPTRLLKPSIKDAANPVAIKSKHQYPPLYERNSLCLQLLQDVSEHTTKHHLSSQRCYTWKQRLDRRYMSGPVAAMGETAYQNRGEVKERVMESITLEDIESYPRVQKPFIDLMWLECKAGNGGNARKHSIRSPSLRGCGYGGHGGDIIFKSSHLYEDFLHLNQKNEGKNGGDGCNTSRGLHGKDLALLVPLGTIVRKRVPTATRSEQNRKIHKKLFWYQFLEDDEKLMVARGGRGGVGSSSRRKNDGRVGEAGEKVLLELELRLMNDVAFVGLPNSGKTSLLASLTRYHTRIGPEAFSTSRPHVAVLRYKNGVDIRVMDLPGLMEGAHRDKHKGRRILRHLYRSKLIVYVIDSSTINEEEERDMLKELLTLRNEVMQFDSKNAKKLEMVVATKCDMLHKDTLYNLDSLFYRLRSRYPDIHVVGTSARFGLGMERAANMIRQMLYPDMVVPANRIFAKSLDSIMLPSASMAIEGVKRLNADVLAPHLPPPNTDEVYNPPEAYTANYAENAVK